MRLPRLVAMTLTLSTLFISVPVTADAQVASLTPDATASAIQVGAKAKGREQGLDLQDSLGALAALDGYGGRDGFSVVLHTPTTWIRQRASNAAKRYETFTPAHVTDDDRAPVLRVTAHPDLPRQVTAAGMRGTSSVDHVVLQDKSRKVTIQPMASEKFDVEAANAVGGRVMFNGLSAQFPLDALRELRGPKSDQEFFVVVIGSTGEEKRFEVKKKHFERLP